MKLVFDRVDGKPREHGRYNLKCLQNADRNQGFDLDRTVNELGRHRDWFDALAMRTVILKSDIYSARNGEDFHQPLESR